MNDVHLVVQRYNRYHRVVEKTVCDSLTKSCGKHWIPLKGRSNVLIHGAEDKKKWLGSQGLGQRSLTTAWLAVATGIYFHKQGRAMFFIPYLSVWSVSFAVFLVLSWARKTCKHAHRVSRQQEHTPSGVDANCMFRKPANACAFLISALALSACIFLISIVFSLFGNV